MNEKPVTWLPSENSETALLISATNSGVLCRSYQVDASGNLTRRWYGRYITKGDVH